MKRQQVDIPLPSPDFPVPKVTVIPPTPCLPKVLSVAGLRSSGLKGGQFLQG